MEKLLGFTLIMFYCMVVPAGAGENVVSVNYSPDTFAAPVQQNSPFLLFLPAILG